MKTTILIGNGINCNSKSKQFTRNSIKKRLDHTLNCYLETIQDIHLYNAFSDAIKYTKNCKGNIEIQTNAIYEHSMNYLINSHFPYWGNYDYKIRSILRKISLYSIFYKYDKFINIIIKKSIVNKILRYDEILTLNYYEYWDKDLIAKYLHNRIKIVNNEIVNYDSCIFSPTLSLPKSETFALYPSEGLYPAEDLYPSGKVNLYPELNNIECLEIFGLSPYGDSELIDKLSNIKNIKIFVFDIKNSDDELKMWRKHLPFAVFVDSKYFEET